MRANQAFLKFLSVSVIAAAVTGCAADDGGDSAQSANSSLAISAYCPFLPSKTFDSQVMVTGTAHYQYRVNGSGPIAKEPLPIRFAEIEVRDSHGAIVQCAETTRTGRFSFALPKNNQNYNVHINSRANNDTLRAYVMTDPQSNLPYAIQQSITTVGDQSIEFTAPASGTLEGGAFNILDQILNANDFLRDKTSAATGCGTTFTDCQPFTVAPLVQIFWRRGYSPAPYVGGSAASSISFYMMGKSQLYIQGGINGDVDNSDTDHFDNPVILHEYGHFLEDQFGKSDSPGGSHNGSSQVDSRLAWSEGWADFIQAAVRSQGDYYDSIGTSEGTAGFAIPPEPLTTAGRTLDIPQNSVVPADGEGTFREFSIARVLWLATDPSGQVQSPFSELWSLFSGANGFRSPNVHFRSISVFNQMHTSRAAPYKDWSTVTTGEHQSLDRSTYATPIQVGGSCGKSAVAKIQPTATYVANYYPTDFLRNNRFYEFDHAGGAVDITLSYNTPSGKLADLDLAIYPEQFVYQQDQILQSASTPPTNCSGGALCAERVVGTLSAGHYLINVTEFFDANSTNSDPGATQFTLTINSQPVCFGP